MKNLMLIAIMAAATFAFVGCKKEETTGDKVGDLIDKAEKGAKDAAKAADKEAKDISKKLDEAVKK
jgi:hypothetical protein